MFSCVNATDSKIDTVWTPIEISENTFLTILEFGSQDFWITKIVIDGKGASLIKLKNLNKIIDGMFSPSLRLYKQGKIIYFMCNLKLFEYDVEENTISPSDLAIGCDLKSKFAHKISFTSESYIIGRSYWEYMPTFEEEREDRIVNGFKIKFICAEYAPEYKGYHVSFHEYGNNEISKEFFTSAVFYTISENAKYLVLKKRGKPEDQEQKIELIDLTENKLIKSWKFPKERRMILDYLSNGGEMIITEWEKGKRIKTFTLNSKRNQIIEYECFYRKGIKIGRYDSFFDQQLNLYLIPIWMNADSSNSIFKYPYDKHEFLEYKIEMKF